MFSPQLFTGLNGESAENRVTFSVSLSIPQQMDKDFVNSSGEELPKRHKATPSLKGRRKHIFTVLLAAFLAVQTWAGDVGDTESVRPNTQAFDREVKEYAELLRLPGLSLAVVQDGSIAHRLHLGFSDVESRKPIADDSIFWLASVTKTFSAVMMMQYEQEDRLSLDDPLIEYPFASVGFSPWRIGANVRLKHVLSHTSEGTPGTAFVYNGGRYNFIYGVFEQMSGFKMIGFEGVPRAIASELDARIVKPLGLEATLAGYPNTNQTSLRARVVTPYVYDSAKQEFIVNRGALNPGGAYPGTGLLSCINDLAAYTTALDRDRLMTGSSYRKMTSPFVLNDGRPSDYGLGWFTTDFAGIRLHWAYGLGDSDSAILLRVPSRKLSLILLCNSTLGTDTSRLGGGNPLTSPFIVAFLKRFVLGNDLKSIDYAADPAKIRDSLNQRIAKDGRTIYSAELLSQAVTRTFAESAFNTPTLQGQALTKLLYEFDRNAFTKEYPVIFDLLLQHSGSGLDEASKLAVESYRASGHFHPWILSCIAKRFEAKGDMENALKYYRLLVDANGFEEAGEKIDAYRILARDYAKHGDLEKARDYFWKTAVYSRQRGGNDAGILEEIGDLSNAAKHNTQRPGL
jgi:CubicO group peptidase (beta-lactamase class C family)